MIHFAEYMKPAGACRTWTWTFPYHDGFVTALKPKRRQDILAEYEELIAPGLELIELKTVKFCLFTFVVSCLLFALDLAFKECGSWLRSTEFNLFSTIFNLVWNYRRPRWGHLKWGFPGRSEIRNKNLTWNILLRTGNAIIFRLEHGFSFSFFMVFFECSQFLSISSILILIFNSWLFAQVYSPRTWWRTSSPCMASVESASCGVISCSFRFFQSRNTYLVPLVERDAESCSRWKVWWYHTTCQCCVV